MHHYSLISPGIGGPGIPRTSWHFHLLSCQIPLPGGKFCLTRDYKNYNAYFHLVMSQALARGISLKIKLLLKFFSPTWINTQRWTSNEHVCTQSNFQNSKKVWNSNPKRLLVMFSRWQAETTRKIFPGTKKREAAWLSGQGIRLTIWRSQVQVPLLPLAGFVLGHPEFKSSAIRL